MSQLTLYRFTLSGHSHRAEVFLSFLGLKANIIDVDLVNGEHKKPDFLQKNIFGQVPVLEDGPNTISDSNAILTYLATKYDKNHSWLPTDPAQLAEVQRFLSVSTGLAAYGPAAARLVTVFKNMQIDHDNAISIAHSLFSVLETHLTNRDWLATDKPTIADIANYTYIAHAPEGGVSLNEYPNIKMWLKRFEALPGFLPMQATKIGLAA